MSSEADKLLDQIKNLDSMVDLETPIPGMKVINDKVIKITAAKLKIALDSNPNHPVAIVYSKVVKKVPPECNMSVSRVDLQCLIEDKEVLLEEDSTGREITKKIGPTRTVLPKSPIKTRKPIQGQMAPDGEKPLPPPPPKKS